jgi:hypothetical protein
MTKLKFSLGIILQLILILIIFTFGWSMCTTNIALNKTAKTTGYVSFASTKTVVNGHSGYFTGFLVEMKHNLDGYWLYRSNGNYDTFFEAIKPLSAITIYHSTTPQSNGYFAIYQLQKGGSIIYSKEEYERKEKLFGFLIVIPSSLVLFLSVLIQVKQRNGKHFAPIF